MKVSVVIPCYNVAPYVEATVMSVLNQTFREIEVIVVNDGSTDDTGEILRKLKVQQHDRRLKIINRPNGRISPARNTGIKSAIGKYIGFLDGDDLWVPEKVECYLAVMAADPSHRDDL